MTTRHYRTDTYRAREGVGYLVRKLYGAWVEHFERALIAADFTLTQWIVLIELRDGLSRTASDIAQGLQHDSGALTRVLDQLERRGLIERQRSARDRRVVELALTPAGQAIVRDLLPVVVEYNNRAVAPLDAAEFRQFRGFLVRLLEHAESGGTHADTARPAAAGKPPKDAARRTGKPRPASVATRRRSTTRKTSPRGKRS